MERIICLAAGYVCGLLQTGYIYGRMNHIDIRQYGSGNSGTTNALRVLGVKAGLIVFLGDFFKTFFPCMLVRVLFRDQPGIMHLLLLYMGFGVILGHNFPFYLKFRGGKGIAAMAGLLTAADIRVALVCLAVFAVTVALTRYVSLGSLLVATVFLAGMVFFGSRGDYGLGTGYLWEFYAAAFVISAMAFWRHRANIGRLIHGNENKLGAKKS